MKSQVVKFFSRPTVQYFCSIILHFLLLFLLFSTSSGRLSLSVPDAMSPENHPWLGSDIMSYIEPAQSYVETGTFARQGKPDMHRTIGYPAFLATLMTIFKDKWIVAAYFLQIVIFASLFPCTSILARLWFRCDAIAVGVIFFVMIGSGVCLAYSGVLLSDQLFTCLLYGGLVTGVAAISRASLSLAILHMILICCAAQVRPTLGLFFLAEFCFLIHTIRLENIIITARTKMIIAACVIACALSGNAPSIRNYIHHGVFTPTTILSDNLARYLAGPILIAQGKQEEYQVRLEEFKNISGAEKIQTQKEFAKVVILQYPKETILRVGYHAFWNLFEPHWEYILNVFSSGFFLNELLTPAGKLNTEIFSGIVWWLGYGVIYFLSVLAAVRCILQKQWYFLIGLMIFLLPLGASFINGQGARMRLYAEPLLICMAISELFVRISQRTMARS